MTQATRWEDEYWEMFAGEGPDMPADDMRVVSLGLLLALDPSLAQVAALETGRGLWRSDGAAPWQHWD